MIWVISLNLNSQLQPLVQKVPITHFGKPTQKRIPELYNQLKPYEAKITYKTSFEKNLDT